MRTFAALKKSLGASELPENEFEFLLKAPVILSHEQQQAMGKRTGAGYKQSASQASPHGLLSRFGTVHARGTGGHVHIVDLGHAASKASQKSGFAEMSSAGHHGPESSGAFIHGVGLSEGGKNKLRLVQKMAAKIGKRFQVGYHPSRGKIDYSFHDSADKAVTKFREHHENAFKGE